MRRIAMLMALALGVVLALPALASYHDEPAVGFRTESCALGSNALPGSGNLLVVDPAGGTGIYTTIGAAVSAATANDYILVRPGTYSEAVVIPATKPGLRIKGTNRNTVILNGGADATHAGATYGFDVRADRVVIENMTAHNYRGTAFYWHGVTGYWGSHLTGYNTGGYGLYAYNARCGQFDHSFGSGNADSAFYIGECYPCEAVIHDVEATGNGLGYSGTNAGGGLIIRDSYWHDNGLGIVPNSLDSEERPPQRGVIIKNNLVAANNQIDAPGSGLTGQFWGAGIVIAGGQNNEVWGNRVIDHAKAGIALAPLPSSNVWLSSANVIWGNTVTHTASYADAFDLGQGASSGPGNCWDDNIYGNSSPPAIQTVWACDLTLTPPGGSPLVEEALFEGAAGLNGRTNSDWWDWPAPASQTNQPDDNGNSNYADDGSVNTYLPALGL